MNIVIATVDATYPWVIYAAGCEFRCKKEEAAEVCRIINNSLVARSLWGARVQREDCLKVLREKRSKRNVREFTRINAHYNSVRRDALRFAKEILVTTGRQFFV